MRIIKDIGLVTVTIVAVAFGILGCLIIAPFAIAQNLFQLVFDRKNCCYVRNYIG